MDAVTVDVAAVLLLSESSSLLLLLLQKSTVRRLVLLDITTAARTLYNSVYEPTAVEILSVFIKLCQNRFHKLFIKYNIHACMFYVCSMHMYNVYVNV